jgi:hypothetical protein
MRLSRSILAAFLVFFCAPSLHAAQAPTPIDLDYYIQNAIRFGRGEGLSQGQKWETVPVSRDRKWSPTAPPPDKAGYFPSPQAEQARVVSVYKNTEDQLAEHIGLNWLMHRDYYRPAPKSEYPQLRIHGEVRTRLFLVRDGMDLGFAAQPRSVLAAGNTESTEEVPPTILQKIQDQYHMFEERITIPMSLYLTPDVGLSITPRVINRHIGNLKYPDEEQFFALQHKRGETTIDEAHLRITRLWDSPWTLRAGRFFLEKDFSIFTGDAEQADPVDSVQLIYTSNPWQVLIEVNRPVFDLLKRSGQPFIGYDMLVLYKNEWLRTISSLVNSVQGKRLQQVDMGQMIEIDVTEHLNIQGAIAYTLGRTHPSGNAPSFDRSAIGALAGLTYAFEDVPFEPFLNVHAYHFSGGNPTRNFDIAKTGEYKGLLAQMATTNLEALTAQATFTTSRFSRLKTSYWVFEQDNPAEQFVSDTQDNGGIQVPTNGRDRGLGQELDIIFEWDLLDNVTTEAYCAWFFPGRAFGNVAERPFEGAAYQVNPFEFRWQLLYRF